MILQARYIKCFLRVCICWSVCMFVPRLGHLTVTWHFFCSDQTGITANSCFSYHKTEELLISKQAFISHNNVMHLYRTTLHLYRLYKQQVCGILFALHSSSVSDLTLNTTWRNKVPIQKIYPFPGNGVPQGAQSGDIMKWIYSIFRYGNYITVLLADCITWSFCPPGSIVKDAMESIYSIVQPLLAPWPHFVSYLI